MNSEKKRVNTYPGISKGILFIFPDSGEYLLSNMKIAEAESYFELGMVTEADQAL